MPLLHEITRKAEIGRGTGTCFVSGPLGQAKRTDGQPYSDEYLPILEIGKHTGIANPFGIEEYSPNNVLG